MTTAPSRDDAALTAALAAMRMANADTRTQLARVRYTVDLKRKEISVLEAHEFALIATIDARARRIDDLLDELNKRRATP